MPVRQDPPELHPEQQLPPTHRPVAQVFGGLEDTAWLLHVPELVQRSSVQVLLSSQLTQVCPPVPHLDEDWLPPLPASRQVVVPSQQPAAHRLVEPVRHWHWLPWQFRPEAQALTEPQVH